MCECGQEEWHFAKCRELAPAVLEGHQVVSMHWVYQRSEEFYRDRRD